MEIFILLVNFLIIFLVKRDLYSLVDLVHLPIFTLCEAWLCSEHRNALRQTSHHLYISILVLRHEYHLGFTGALVMCFWVSLPLCLSSMFFRTEIEGNYGFVLYFYASSLDTFSCVSECFCCYVNVLGFSVFLFLFLDLQVACTSMKSNEVLIFDISYISSEPVEVSFSIHFLSAMCFYDNTHIESNIQ